MEDQGNIGVLHTKTQVLLDKMKTHWRKMDTEDATGTQAPSKAAAPLASETTASTAVSAAEREVVVRVLDRSDSVSDLEPTTRRPRYEGFQSNSEPIGPLATLPFRATVVDAAPAKRDQLEDHFDFDHEETTQPQSSQQHQQRVTRLSDRPWQNFCRHSQHSKVTRELLQHFADFHVSQEKKCMLDC